MKESVRKDIMAVLRDSLKSIGQGNVASLKEISDHVIHTASITQEDSVISVAVIIYSLSKIFDKWQYRKDKRWNRFKGNVVKELERSLNRLEKGEIKSYKDSTKNFFKIIGDLDDKVGLYITHVINQARIKKGSRVYEHGVSVGRVAKVLGVSEWDLLTYLGNTKIVDKEPVLTKRVKERLLFTRRLFS